jgi:hypothetical protein
MDVRIMEARIVPRTGSQGLETFLVFDQKKSLR